MKTLCVYTHWHHDTGYPVCFYVGKGTLDPKRGVQRPWSNVRSAFWKSVVAQHGFTVVINATGLTEAEAFEMERRLIAQIGRRDLGTGTLVNLTPGGEGVLGREPWNKGKPASPEVLVKLRAAKLGKKASPETRRKMSAGRAGVLNAFYGRKHTQETKDKISATKLNKAQ